MVNSTATARANGYVAGHGKINSPEDLEGMGLTLEGKKTLFQIWKNSSGLNCSINWDSNTDAKSSSCSLSNVELKEKLTPQQYNVTQENGTEKPFNNKYWNHKKEGIYVDIVSNEALFSSTDKFQSGTGWPSFTKPIDPNNM